MPFADIGDARLHYVDDDFAAPWGPPLECVLMQHWFLGDHTEFAPWVPILARHWRVVRMDRRGNGRSDKPARGYEFTAAGLVDDVVRFLDVLGIERVHYVGQSTGGVLGALLAVAHPDRVQTLVLCSTPMRVNDRSFTIASSPVEQRGSWLHAHVKWLDEYRPEGGRAHALTELYRTQQSAQVPAHVVAALMRLTKSPGWQLDDVLGAIPVPTLMLSPSISTTAPLDEQRRMCAMIPDCRQVVIEDADHMIALEHPQRCADETARFILEHSPGGPTHA